jgi:hypothetical protein
MSVIEVDERVLLLVAAIIKTFGDDEWNAIPVPKCANARIQKSLYSTRG